MEAPSPLRTAANERDDVTITRREYDGETLVVVDFGPDVDAVLDVVGETVIVVAGDRQFEFETPPDSAELTTNNGMVVIEE